MRKATANFLRDEAGTSAIDYSIMAGLIGIALTYALVLLGSRIKALLAFLGWAIGPAAQ